MELARLVVLAQEGDEAAKSELIQLASRLVYARLFKSLKDGGEREDVVQDIVLAVLDGLPRLRNPRAFLLWLRRTADNILADHFAGHQPPPVKTSREPVSAAFEAEDPISILEGAHERKKVRAALASLSPRSRLAVELFYFGGLSCREVAEFLRASPGAVKARLTRARRELRRRLVSMKETERKHFRHMITVVSGEAVFDGPPFEHDSETEKLFLALYPRGHPEAAGRTAGLSSGQIRRELQVLQDMRMVEPEEGDGYRCTSPVAHDVDIELVRVWAEPIADVVIRHLDSLHEEVSSLAEFVEGDLARSTVMAVGLRGEAARRPFEALRERLDASAPERGRFGKFSVALFVSQQKEPPIVAQGLLGINHYTADRREWHTYFLHPLETTRPGLESLRNMLRGIGTARTQPADPLSKIMQKLGTFIDSGLTPESKIEASNQLKVPHELEAEFWRLLSELHAVEERSGRTVVTIPQLPLDPWKEYLARLSKIGAEISDTVAEAAEDLRRRTIRCSFADCFFADSVLVFISCLQSIVGRAIEEKEWVKIPAQADFSWGALIVR